MPVIVRSKNPHPLLPSTNGNTAMDEKRAQSQDIRPLEILVINMMADKQATERQLADWLGKTPLQVNVTFAATNSYIDAIKGGTYEPGNTPSTHINDVYSAFGDVKHKKFDGVVITGVNAKEQDITKEAFWPEIKQILDWTTTNATSALFLCWGAQAALKHFHGIDRHRSPQKTYGVYEHRVAEDRSGILKGFADVFPVPVSRWNEIRASDIRENPALEIVSVSDKAGVGLIAESRTFEDGTKRFPNRIYSLIHPEYETGTLDKEYRRDSRTNSSFPLPHNYYPDNKPESAPVNTWRQTGEMYANWVNLVYEATQFDLNMVPAPFRRAEAAISRQAGARPSA